MKHKKRPKNAVKKQFAPKAGGAFFLLAFVAVVVAGGVFLPRLFARQKKQPMPTENPSMLAKSQAVGQFVSQATMPTQLALNLPDLQFPALQLPPVVPQFSFSEEEVAQLNQNLENWALEETFVLKELLEKDGQTDANPQSGPETAEKKEYVADGGHNVAMWFMDVESGTKYAYNQDFLFSYASLMKAPYAAWLYTLAEGGICNLEEEIEVKPQDIGKYKENTGLIKEMQLPAKFTVEQLIGFMLRNSDTVALKMLLVRHSAQDFTAWAQQQGLQNASGINSVISGKMNAADMGALMLATYQVMQTGQFGQNLRQHMENATNRMIVSQYPVARKYGWDEKAYHDMGAVFAPHPFIIVIMTDKWGGSYAETAAFGNISKSIEAMMENKWAAHQEGAQ